MLKNNIITFIENKKNFFEGYYFKHQKDNNLISFIIGKSSEEEFIQIITNDGSFHVPYIGKNIFSCEGIEVNINYKDIVVEGKIKYSNLTPIKSDIMGPFKYFPMECRHTIVSMNHGISGSLFINNRMINFSGGKGYIEGDSGRSFPKNYRWIQCNDFKRDLSIMASVADIPFLMFNFKGCICVIMYNGKEYRLATYLGVKILKYNKNEIFLKQGKYRLDVKILDGVSQNLQAPNNGKMIRTISERLSCKANFKFFIDNKVVFDVKSNHASFE